eukprot:10066614-Lingulodinium_polyedra.AAC.1
MPALGTTISVGREREVKRRAGTGAVPQAPKGQPRGRPACKAVWLQRCRDRSRPMRSTSAEPRPATEHAKNRQQRSLHRRARRLPPGLVPAPVVPPAP